MKVPDTPPAPDHGWREFSSTEDAWQVAYDNRGLVETVIHKIAQSEQGIPVMIDRDDLRSFAWEGMFQAVTKFKPALGNQFSTFAHKCVRNRIFRGISELQRGRKPFKGPAFAQPFGDPTTPVRNPHRGDEDDAPTPTAEAAIVPDHADAAINAVLIQQATKNLTDKEKEVVGLLFYGQHTMNEVAEELSCSRERVRQIREGAFVKMRQALPQRAALFEGEIDEGNE